MEYRLSTVEVLNLVALKKNELAVMEPVEGAPTLPVHKLTPFCADEHRDIEVPTLYRLAPIADIPENQAVIDDGIELGVIKMACNFHLKTKGAPADYAKHPAFLPNMGVTMVAGEDVFQLTEYETIIAMSEMLGLTPSESDLPKPQNK